MVEILIKLLLLHPYTSYIMCSCLHHLEKLNTPVVTTMKREFLLLGTILTQQTAHRETQNYSLCGLSQLPKKGCWAIETRLQRRQLHNG